MSVIPEHVRMAFQAFDGAPVALPQAWDYGFRLEQLVLCETADPEPAAWAAKVREGLHPDGVRVARPIRTTDGRLIVAGWRASHFVEGVASKRVDETVAAALRLADALRDVAIPPFATAPMGGLVTSRNCFAIADRAAWSEDPGAVLQSCIDTKRKATERQQWGLAFAAELGQAAVPLQAPDQVGHADMLATTIFQGMQPPVVTDIIGVAHPHGYTAAQVIIDGLLAGLVDDDIVRRFSQIPDIDQLLLRALLYRVYIHALHPAADANARSTMERVGQLLLSGVAGTI